MKPLEEFTNVCDGRSSPYCSVYAHNNSEYGIDCLKEMFSSGVNHLNFVLFSTSGTHGTYATIEDAESIINNNSDDFIEITFLIIHPRMVSLKYGTCIPKTQDDIDFLKFLRSASKKVILEIGEN